MARSRFGLRLAAVLAALGIAPVALAASGSDEHDEGTHEAAAAHEGGTHEEGAHHAEHGGAHGHEINWYYGFFSESDDPEVEEDFIVRKKGTPVPLLSFFFNAGLLFAGIYFFTRKAVKDGLVARRTGIMRGIEEASKMKTEAEQQLAHYTEKLRSADAEIDRVRREMSEAAAAERARIVADAKARRERMEREARELVLHELEAMREELMLETAKGAVKAAEKLLSEAVNDGDHERLTNEYLGSLSSTISARGRA